jgi:hypothetical protein
MRHPSAIASFSKVAMVAEENARVCRWLARHEHADLALEFLIRSLETERPLSRDRAAAVLFEIGPRARPSLAALEACLKCDDEDVRTAVAAAIDRIRGEPQISNEIANSASPSR